MTEESFQYRSLDLQNQSVRLLMLRAGYGSDDLSCDLIEADLEEPMPYSALSYTWGESTKGAEIWVNGARLGITKSLESALRHLRQRSEDQVLWIDQICINQKDIKERNHQAQQMSQIYKKAERTIVWLGEATEDSDKLMDLLSTLDKNTSVAPESLPKLQTDVKAQHSTAFEALLRRPWFYRAWILQEIANARAATIFCGQKSVPSRTFILLPTLTGLESIGPHCKRILDAMPSASRPQSSLAGRTDLNSLLLNFQPTETSEPVDKIFAFVGISSDASQCEWMRPDYDLPLERLINRTVCFILGLPETKQLDHFNLLKNHSLSTIDDLFMVLPNLTWACLSQCISEGDFQTAAEMWRSPSIRFQHGDEIYMNAFCFELGALMYGHNPPVSEAFTYPPYLKLLIESRDSDIGLPITELSATINEIAQEPNPSLREKRALELFSKTNIKFNVNKPMKDGLLPFERANKDRNGGATRLLLSQSDLNTAELLDRNAPQNLLLESVKRHLHGIVRALVAHAELNVNVNATDPKGRTALFFALGLGTIERSPDSRMVRLLLTREDLDTSIRYEGNIPSDGPAGTGSTSDGYTATQLAIENLECSTRTQPEELPRFGLQHEVALAQCVEYLLEENRVDVREDERRRGRLLVGLARRRSNGFAGLMGGA